MPSGSPIAGYKEFISRRATDGHFVKANGRFSKANAFMKGNGRFIKADGRFIKANGYLASRPMAILSRPMPVLSRGATLGNKILLRIFCACRHGPKRREALGAAA